MVAEVKGVVGEGGEVLRFCLLGDVHSFLLQFSQSLSLEMVLLTLPLGSVALFGHTSQDAIKLLDLIGSKSLLKFLYRRALQEILGKL